MESVAGLLLLGLVSLLVGTGLFLFVLGLGLLRWARFRAVLYLLPTLLLAAGLIAAGGLQLCFYLVPDFTEVLVGPWGQRLALLQVGGAAGATVNLVFGLLFLAGGAIVGRLFYQGTQQAIRVGRRRRHSRQTVRLFSLSARKASRRARASTTDGRKATTMVSTPRRATGSNATPTTSGRFLRLGFRR